MAGGGSAGAWSVASTGGSVAEPNPEEFEPMKVVGLETFLSEWGPELSGRLQDYSFNPEWPEGRLTTNEKYLKTVAQGLVFSAMALLGCKIDQGISPSRVLQQLATPSVGFYVSTGHRAQGTNRQR